MPIGIYTAKSVFRPLSIKATIQQRNFSALLPPQTSFRSAVANSSRTVRLLNGKHLGVAQFGTPTGHPVFYFHGTLGSRLEAKGWHDFAVKASARLIGVDRPGIGLSNLPKHSATLLEWPEKVQQLADHLKIDEFSVLGCSGGGPYALACARVLLKDRLRSTGVVAGMGPVQYGFADTSWQRYLAFQTNRYLPSTWLHWVIDRSYVRPALNPNPDVFEKDVIDKVIKHVLPPSDAAFYKDPAMKQDFVDDWRQAFAQGAGGYVQDAKINFSPWGFSVADIEGQVRLWYGTKDTFTPVGVGRYLASHIPDAKLTEVPGATHFSISDEGVEILGDLVQGD